MQYPGINSTSISFIIGRAVCQFNLAMYSDSELIRISDTEINDKTHFYIL